MAETSLEGILRFNQLVSAARRPVEILEHLTAGASEVLGAREVGVFEVTEEGTVTLVASRNLPERIAGWTLELDEVGPELGVKLRDACESRLSHVETFPLAAGGDLFGLLVLFTPAPFDSRQRRLAEALADLSATAVGRSIRYDQLERSYQELRASREALAKSEKLRALGQMAAGIVHDLKNILNPLSLQLQLMRRRFGKDQKGAQDLMQQMEVSLKYGADTVERLRNFSRQEREPVQEHVELDQLVTSAVGISRPRFPASVSLQLELGASCKVFVNRSELVTALVNLLVNAVDAMASGGTLSVRTGQADGGAWIEVADTGPGMSPEVASRVFEPFFTTKTDGTGLGLAMVYALVQRSAGRITLETAPGEGARFTLWFPTQPGG